MHRLLPSDSHLRDIQGLANGPLDNGNSLLNLCRLMDATLQLEFPSSQTPFDYVMDYKLGSKQPYHYHSL